MKIKINNKMRTLAILIAAISLFFLFAYGYALNNNGKNAKNPDNLCLEVEPLNIGCRAAAIGKPLKKPFEGINLEAKAAYVFDILNNKPIFKLNDGAQLPLASLTKIMTAVVARESLPEWLEVKIPIEAILQEGDSGFLAGEQWKITNLLEAMLISSSNDAAYAIAMAGSDSNPDFGYPIAKKFEGGNTAGRFISLMNKKAKEMRLDQTYFLNPTGLDLSGSVAGAYGSAQDVARLLGYAFRKYPSLFGVTRYNSLNINSREFKNTDKLAKEIPGLIGGKTGFSDLAGGNLAIITDIGLGHPVSIVVMGSSEEGRFKDVRTLYKETVKWFISRH